jgi:hypothetical protein
MFKRKPRHYLIAGNGSLLSMDVIMTPRMVQRLKELSPQYIVALDIEPS